MVDLASVLGDLAAEGDALDRLVTAANWATPTPAEGWTITHQVAHLAWTDDVARTAITDADAWAQLLDRAAGDPYGFVDAGAQEWSAHPGLLTTWRAGRAALVEALRDTDKARIDWFGPPMSPTSMATARLMETWAHGQDVADALGVSYGATDRIRHVAHLGVRTRDFAFGINELPPPADAFRVELVGPSGALWTWGPEDALQRVSGPALDFCLLATRRRHRDDLALVAEGPDADRWLDIAQAFAGPPGTGRPSAKASL